jgi:hypothetical protein
MTDLSLVDRLKAAVFMVGNMDTPEDKAAWWATFGPLWEEVAAEGPEVQRYADTMAQQLKQPEEADDPVTQFLRVTEQEMKQLQSLIENPPQPNEALKNAMSKFRDSRENKE